MAIATDLVMQSVFQAMRACVAVVPCTTVYIINPRHMRERELQ